MFAKVPDQVCDPCCKITYGQVYCVLKILLSFSIPSVCDIFRCHSSDTDLEGLGLRSERGSQSYISVVNMYGVFTALFVYYFENQDCHN
jgi:hypothetical protein